MSDFFSFESLGDAGRYLRGAVGLVDTTAQLTKSIAPVAAALSKQLPVAGAVLAGMTVAAEVGQDVMKGQHERAFGALLAGGAEVGGGLIGFGAGPAFREAVREGLSRTAGEKFTPEKSSLRQSAEAAFGWFSKPDEAVKAAGPKPPGLGGMTN